MTKKREQEIEQQLEQHQELDEVLTICALRFDGYKYWSRRYREFGHEHEGEMGLIVEPVEKERILYDEDLDNLTVFFCLQRYLYKWGGEHNTPWSNAHVVFRQLFLHCYRMEIPDEYRMDEFFTTWTREFQPRREEWAARIRNSFCTVGDGPSFI